MKVLHIGLSSHFTDKMLYQDNILAECNAKNGHDTTYITDTYMYRDGVLVKTEECDTVLDNGVRLIRIAYDTVINPFVTIKIQKAKKLCDYLEEIAPDTILYHGMCGYELMDTARYAERKGIPFYIDAHTNFKNTAMTSVSKMAYKYIHGYFVKKALPAAKKVLYIGFPEKEYLKEMYHIPESVLEYFPLGGMILPKEEQARCRAQMIAEMGFPNDVIICAHSGKMGKGKKTEEVLRAFDSVRDQRLRLLVFGAIPDEMKPVLLPLIEKDDRISFLGWKNATEQKKILGATDLYIQPGTYSATAQIAICDGCAIILNRDYRSAMGDAAFYEETSTGVAEVLNKIVAEGRLLDEMKQKCFDLAMSRFDYQKLAGRYLE